MTTASLTHRWTFWRRLQTILLLWLLLTATACRKTEVEADAPPAQSAPAQTRPNIIVIMADDMGIADIGCYGSEIKTPNLDRLAARGLRYTQFYNTARCCPTRASLLTGLYPHQAGIGHMMENRGLPAYQGDLNRQCVTLAEVLGASGYRTYMAGKWHVTPIRNLDDKHNWPLQRGFDRFFGTIHGAGSFYDPATLARDNERIPPGEDFYYTDAISDEAVRYVREHPDDRPFFMYVAYTAAHWPMHALPRDIAKYRGRYDQGWEVLRRERHARMQALGVVETEWVLSEADPKVPDWDSQADQAWHARCMEVYAAMIDNMDQGIGRLVGELERRGQLDNTLMLYLQDNGACAEQFGFGRQPLTPAQLAERRPMDPNALQTLMVPKVTRDGKPLRVWQGVDPGPADTYLGYSAGWAHAGNTPFQWYKHWVHEGGIASPLIAHWPRGIPARGKWRHQPAHLIDIMATCVEVAEANYPAHYRGEAITALEGVSLVPSFENRLLQREAIYWEHEGNRAVRSGQWKLVSKAQVKPRHWDATDVLPLDQWELYDMENDRTETHNLAEAFPGRVQEMADLWQRWAERTGGVPKPKPKSRS
jgi:arylsulfatase